MTTRPVQSWLGPGRLLDPTNVQREQAELTDRAPATDGAPFTVGRYVLERPIGSGGFGVVYLAHDPELDRRVAIKRVRRGDGLEHAQQRLLHEARAIARLEHPNIVTVHDVVGTSDAIYIVMELVEGQPMRSWMKQGRSWREVCEVFVQAGAALAHAHAEGLAHRDFKPGNVMLGNDDRVVVLDFGLARSMGEAEVDWASRRETSEGFVANTASVDDATHQGAVVGTLGYMPPERLFGDDLGPLSDQYSFCVALFEALFGQRPFSGACPQALEQAQRRGAALLPAHRRRAPRWLRATLERGLAYDADERFPDMEALVGTLTRGLERRRRRTRIAAVVALVGLSTAGATWASTRDQRCSATDTEAQLGGVWDADRKAAVEDAMLGTGASYREVAWSRTADVLDAYAVRWTRMHTEACHATVVRGEQSHTVMDARMACLGRARMELDAAVHVLDRADDNTVRAAHAVTDGLFALEQCADLEALTSSDGEPAAAEAEDVEAIRAHLARARAAGRSARYTEATEAIEAANALLEGVEYELVHVETAVVEGWLLEALGDNDAAEAKLRLALRRASALRHWDLLYESASGLLWIVGARRESFEEAMRYGDIAQALAKGNRRREAQTAGHLGGVLYVHGDLTRAAAQYTAAIDYYADETVSQRAQHATARTYLAMVLWAQGKFDAAAKEHREGIATLEEELGRDHPRVAEARVGYANALHSQSKIAEAAAELRAALPVLEQSLGREHATTVSARVDLANAALARGELAQAEAVYRDALAGLESSLGPDHSFVASVRSNLAVALSERGEHAQAETELRRALASFGPDHPAAANAHHALAESLRAQGRLDNAEAEYRHGLALYDDSELGAEHPLGARIRSTLAALSLERGDAQAARSLAHSAWTVQRAGSSFLAAGETAFVLARALAASDDPGDRHRALELAEEAIAMYRKADAADSTEVAEITAWLEQR